MTKGMAGGLFTTGLVLIGFGFMIFLLPKFFATLAAIVFFIVGGTCAITALKMLLALHKFDKMSEDQTGDQYRQNVRIHTEEDWQ